MSQKAFFHELPNSIKPLVSLLMSQNQDVIDSGDWDKVEFELWKTEEQFTVKIPSAEIGFTFSKDGRLDGIYNYKE